jgi:tRNA threonylcarbamoyladenosine biosynthesis protein TsaB
MICLGIDTSGLVARVAVAGGGGVTARMTTEPGKTHSETLLAAVRGVLDTAGIPIASVGLVAVGLGPGAWTGLRVGITTAKAFAYGLGVPIVGISTLDATAAGVTGYTGALAVIVDARRHEIYGRRYTADGKGGIAADGDFFVTPPGDLDRFVGPEYALVGNGVGLLPEGGRVTRRVLPEEFGEVDPGTICRLAVERYGLQGPDIPRDVGPIYVRKSDAETAREKKEGVIENIS